VLADAGITSSTLLTKDLIRDPARAVPLVMAMARQEAGRDFPLTAELWKKAHGAAFGVAEAAAFSPANSGLAAAVGGARWRRRRDCNGRCRASHAGYSSRSHRLDWHAAGGHEERG
jgi:hypothetical protein